MSENNSTPSATSGKPTKPAKPYPEFPLTAHPAGYWCKKIRGKVHYFGKWDDLDGALDKYNEQKDDLHAGRTPRPDADALTVKGIANAFLKAKRDAVDAGELSMRTWMDYHSIMEMMGKGMGPQRGVTTLQPHDFAALKVKLAKRNGPHRMCTVIQVIRCAFKYVYESGLIDRPMRFGPAFKRTSKKTLRLHRAKQGPKLFTAEEIRNLLDAAKQPLKAMLLLGINCGFGNSDCGNLPLSAVKLDAAMIDYPRPKIGIARRCPLWPETVQALYEAMAKRPEPKGAADAGLCFVTKYRQSWSKTENSGPLHHEMKKLLDKLGVNGRKGLGFYTLRHTFRTVADDAKDQPATDFIMGHESPHMSSVYRETISNERMKAVTDYVRGWLFAPPKVADATTEVVVKSLCCEE